MSAAIKLLYLLADPSSEIHLDREIRELKEILQPRPQRRVFELIDKWAVEPDVALDALNDIQPQIINFSGHGTEQREIVFEDAAGSPHPVSQEALTRYFKLASSSVRLVVLNACDSKAQAKAIAKHVDCVIGMRAPIFDYAAITFARAFYRALAAGDDVQRAFDFGCAAIALNNADDPDTPQLYPRKGIDPSTIRFVKPKASRLMNPREVHGYTGRWDCDIVFSKWRDRALAEGETARVDGTVDLYIPEDDSAMGYGSVSGVLHVTLHDYACTLHVNDTIDNVTVRPDGALSFFSRTHARQFIERDGVPEKKIEGAAERLKGPQKFLWQFTLDPNSDHTLVGTYCIENDFRDRAAVTLRKRR